MIGSLWTRAKRGGVGWGSGEGLCVENAECVLSLHRSGGQCGRGHCRGGGRQLRLALGCNALALLLRQTILKNNDEQKEHR